MSFKSRKYCLKGDHPEKRDDELYINNEDLYTETETVSTDGFFVGVKEKIE